MLLQSDSLFDEAVRSRSAITASQLGGRRALVRVVVDSSIRNAVAVFVRRAGPFTTGFQFLANTLDAVVASSQIGPSLFQTATSIVVGDGPAVSDPAISILPIPPSAGGLRAVFAVVRDDVVVVTEFVEVDDSITLTRHVSYCILYLVGVLDLQSS